MQRRRICSAWYSRTVQKEKFKINRKGEEVEVGVTPVQNKNGTYMLGAWVRDDLAGIGTLTYYKEDGTYGALGHAVSDGDAADASRCVKAMKNLHGTDSSE